MRGLQDLLRERLFFPIHATRMELSLYRFPNKTSHASIFLGRNAGDMKVDAVTQEYAVLSHG